MPRSLNFEYKGEAFDLELLKVDRSKLYGEVDLETFDSNDKKCRLATLARDGRTIIPYGGTTSGYLNQDGHWIERDELVPVTLKGEKLPEVPSTFDITSALDNEVSIEEYLDHSIRLSYLLKADGAINDAFLEALKGGAIFRIEFSYRGGSFADPAFLIAGDDDLIWLMIGEPGEVEFIGYEQAAICAAHGEEETDDDEDDADTAFDFDML